MRYVVFHPHGLIDINNRSKYQLMVSVFIVDKIPRGFYFHRSSVCFCIWVIHQFVNTLRRRNIWKCINMSKTDENPRWNCKMRTDCFNISQLLYLLTTSLHYQSLEYHFFLIMLIQKYIRSYYVIGMSLASFFVWRNYYFRPITFAFADRSLWFLVGFNLTARNPLLSSFPVITFGLPFGSFVAFISTLILQSWGNGLLHGTGNVDSKIISCSGFFSSTVKDVFETLI